jgi:TonB family protein
LKCCFTGAVGALIRSFELLYPRRIDRHVDGIDFQEKGAKVARLHWWLLLSAFSLSSGATTAQKIPPETPRVLTAVAPEWPAVVFGIKEPKEQSSTATATVEVTIDAKGDVTAVKSMKSHPLVLAASLKAARRWHFSPGDQGRTAQLTFSFVVFDKGTPDENPGTVFHPPYEIEIRRESPATTVNN